LSTWRKKPAKRSPCASWIARRSFGLLYIPIEGGVRIIRLLHTAQDWYRLLDLPD